MNIYRRLVFVFVSTAFIGIVQAGPIHVPKDHPTIQKAIAAADAGDLILVAPGTYRERLVLKADIRLHGEGGAEKTIIDGGGETGGMEPGVKMAEGSEIIGFTVTHVGRYDDELWKKHWETRGDEQEHDDIGGVRAPGILADGVNCRIIECLVHHNGDTGIAIRGAKAHPQVLRNKCYRNMGGGIGAMGGVGGLVENNECYENFFAGIGHNSGAKPLIHENRCHGNIRAGIGVSEGSCPTVRNNHCAKNRRAGIGIRTGTETRPVIIDNVCVENEMAGIGVEDEAEPILSGNRCEKNKMAGIGLQKGARALIAHNFVGENAEAGIGLRPGTEAVLWKNECVENGMVAIGLPEQAKAVMVGNRLENENGTMPPLVAVRGGSEAVLVDNELRGGGVAGVLVDGRAVLSNNRIFGRKDNPAGHGVWIWKDATAIGSGNQVTGRKSATTVAEGGAWIGEKPE